MGNVIRLAVVVLCLAMSPLAQAGPSPAADSQAWLQSFPAPETVRSDIVARAGEARPEEIEGRVAGRLLMLAGVLENSWKTGYVNRETGEPIMGIEGAPAAAKELREAYLQEYRAIRDGKRKEYMGRDDCEGLFVRFLDFGMTPRERCDFRRYVSAEGDYKTGEGATAEAAELYFPAQDRARFVASTPGAVTGKWVEGNIAAREAARASSPEGRKAAKRKVALMIGLAALVPFVLGIVLVVRAVKLHRQLDRYEFDNRTSGGAVEFDDYEAKEAHRRKAWRKDAMAKLAGLLIAIGVLGLSLAGTMLALE